MPVKQLEMFDTPKINHAAMKALITEESYDVDIAFDTMYRELGYSFGFVLNYIFQERMVFYWGLIYENLQKNGRAYYMNEFKLKGKNCRIREEDGLVMLVIDTIGKRICIWDEDNEAGEEMEEKIRNGISDCLHENGQQLAAFLL